MLSLLQKQFSQDSLPYHIIVPSLPGYGLSSKYTADKFTLGDATRLINSLMVELGFGNGYVTQGGDMGGVISTMLVSTYQECKACHGRISIQFPNLPSSHWFQGLLIIIYVFSEPTFSIPGSE